MVEKQIGKEIKVIRSDKRRKYLSNDFEAYFNEARIRRYLTSAKIPQSNEVAKRMNRTLMERARSMMFEKGVPEFLWTESINTAAYIKDRIPTRANGNKTPEEKFSGKRPDLFNIRLFGSKAYIHIHDDKRKS